MNDAMKNMIGVSFEVLRDNSDSVVFDFSDEVDDSDIFVIDGVEFIRLSAIGNGLDFNIYEEDVDNLLCIYPANADLPKDSFRMDLILGVAMDPDAEGSIPQVRLKQVILIIIKIQLLNLKLQNLPFSSSGISLTLQKNNLCRKFVFKGALGLKAPLYRKLPNTIFTIDEVHMKFIIQKKTRDFYY